MKVLILGSYLSCGIKTPEPVVRKSLDNLLGDMSITTIIVSKFDEGAANEETFAEKWALERGIFVHYVKSVPVDRHNHINTFNYDALGIPPDYVVAYPGDASVLKRAKACKQMNICGQYVHDKRTVELWN